MNKYFWKWNQSCLASKKCYNQHRLWSEQDKNLIDKNIPGKVAKCQVLRYPKTCQVVPPGLIYSSFACISCLSSKFRFSGTDMHNLEFPNPFLFSPFDQSSTILYLNKGLVPALSSYNILLYPAMHVLNIYRVSQKQNHLLPPYSGT